MSRNLPALIVHLNAIYLSWISKFNFRPMHFWSPVYKSVAERRIGECRCRDWWFPIEKEREKELPSSRRVYIYIYIGFENYHLRSVKLTSPLQKSERVVGAGEQQDQPQIECVDLITVYWDWRTVSDTIVVHEKERHLATPDGSLAGVIYMFVWSGA